MLGLVIVCWCYLIWNILGRVVNYNNCGKDNNVRYIIDNIVIFVLILILYFLTK
jgi:hypothetical protein